MLKGKRILSVMVAIIFFVGSVFIGLPMMTVTATGGFTNFITRSGDQLMDGSTVYRFMSIAAPALYHNEDLLASDGSNIWANEYEISDVLDSIAQMGGTATRVYTIPIMRSGDTNSDKAILTGIRTYNENGLRALDKAIQLAEQKGVRLLIPFIDAHSFPSWGGIPDFADFRDLQESDFWTNSLLKQDFKNLIYDLLERTNYYTGVKYKDSKAILAWQLGNELQLMGCTDSWSSEMAAYIKSVDSNHLVMDGRDSSFNGVVNDSNIDIVGAHYYQYWDGTPNLVGMLNYDRSISVGKKAIIIDEFGMGDTVNIDNLMDAIISSGTTGGMLWGIRGHKRDGGFYTHSEGITESYHWPGFAKGDWCDETNLLALLRSRAYEIRGMSEPPIPVPAAPTLLDIQDVHTIRWQGSVGAQAYDVERATSSSGPWNVIGSDVLDSASETNPYQPFDDTTALGGTYYYRVKAKNSSGSSGYSNIVGPVVIQTSPIHSLPAKIEGEDYSTQSGTTTYNTSSASNGQYVGSYGFGDNTDYNVNVPYTGNYTINFRVASLMENTQFQLKNGATVLATIDVGNTGGWENWVTRTATVALSEGDQTWDIVPTGSTEYPNLDYFEVISLAQAGVLTDEMSDFTKMYSHSMNLVLDGTNSNLFNGDVSRLCRTASTYEYVVYNTPDDMVNFMADTYFWPIENVNDFKFYISDDGSAYSEIIPTRNVVGGDWGRIIYESSSMPVGTKYLKIEFRNTSGNVWTPQISRIEIEY